jgi:hypothetical protein
MNQIKDLGRIKTTCGKSKVILIRRSPKYIYRGVGEEKHQPIADAWEG